MLTVKGIQRKSGKFEGNAYDNFYLHCLNDAPSKPAMAGETCEILKVKANQVSDVFAGVVRTDDDWRKLIGAKVRAYFDQYGNATLIQKVDEQAVHAK